MKRFNGLSWFWVACILQLYGMAAQGAEHYVRAGASGNGSDWGNAYGSIPATLTRGDTYYVADGEYGTNTYTFDDAVSGTTLITLKKATVADHGTSTGWSDTLGDGQAVFGPWYVVTGYYFIDGQLEYGFKCDASPGQGAILSIAAPHVTMRYIDADGISSTTNHYYAPGLTLVGASISRGASNTLVSHVSIHGVHTQFEEGDGNRFNGYDSYGTVIEYCKLYDGRSYMNTNGTDGPHANIYFCTGSTNGIFRYNRCYNYNDEGFFLTWWESSPMQWQIYGNVFYTTDNGEVNPRGVELRQGGNFTNVLIYNNTIYGMVAIANRAYESANVTVGVEIVNNLAYPALYNTFNYGDTAVRFSNIVASSANIFANPSAYDFRLVAAMPGLNLSPPYSRDMRDIPRGSDGVWDIGAFEYTSGGTVSNAVILVSPPVFDFGSVAIGSSTNLSLTVRNLGSGNLVGLGSVNSPFTIISGNTYGVASGATQVVVVAYAPLVAGSNSQNLTFSGGGGAEVPLSGIGEAVSPPPANGLSFDAASGIVTAPFVYANGYLSQSSETGVAAGGKAVYSFNLTNSGKYVILATVNAPGDGANSVFVNIDADPQDPFMISDIPITAGFEQRVVTWRGSGSFTNSEFVPKVFNLSTGVHQLVIVGREPNVQLQRLRIIEAVDAPLNFRRVGP